MSDLVTVEEYPEFSVAADRAKELADWFQETTGLARTDTGWAVLASTEAQSFLAPPATGVSEEDEAMDAELDFPDDTDEVRAYQEELARELFEELHGDEDAWARSESEGWYYDD